MHRTENTASNSSSIVACVHYPAMVLVLLHIYEAVPEQWLSCRCLFHVRSPAMDVRARVGDPVLEFDNNKSKLTL
jgi:hypothetical protein